MFNAKRKILVLCRQEFIVILKHLLVAKHGFYNGYLSLLT